MHAVLRVAPVSGCRQASEVACLRNVLEAPKASDSTRVATRAYTSPLRTQELITTLVSLEG